MKKLLYLAIVFAYGSLISCNRNTPEINEVTPANCFEAIQQYFPYSLNKPLAFENMSSGKLWELNPNDRFNDGNFPEFHLYDIDRTSKSPTSWSCSGFSEFMVDKNNYRKGLLSISQNIGADGQTGYVAWSVFMLYDDSSELIRGEVAWDIPTSDIFSVITDTIIVSMGYICTHYTDTTIEKQDNPNVGKGAYARIVKNMGLTDFSLDGQSIWHLVEKQP